MPGCCRNERRDWEQSKHTERNNEEKQANKDSNPRAGFTKNMDPHYAESFQACWHIWLTRFKSTLHQGVFFLAGESPERISDKKLKEYPTASAKSETMGCSFQLRAPLRVTSRSCCRQWHSKGRLAAGACRWRCHV